MDQDDHAAAIELADIKQAVFESLPEGDCRRIYEIYQQCGAAYDEFREIFDYDGKPFIQHIATFLGTTPTAVKKHVAFIRHTCLANQFTLAAN